MKIWQWIVYRLFGIKPRSQDPIGPNPVVRTTEAPEGWKGDQGIEPEKFKFDKPKRGFFS